MSNEDSAKLQECPICGSPDVGLWCGQTGGNSARCLNCGATATYRGGAIHIWTARRTVECPACGGIGAYSDEGGRFENNQPLMCGCAGKVKSNGKEAPYVSITDWDHRWKKRDQ
jgi:DNA-directed RNA polymerase subunit RPC12/RpoP